MKVLRIWFACVLAFSVAVLLDWTNGFFCALFPLFILSNLDRWNSAAIGQLIIGTVWTGIQVSLIIGFLQPYPILMSIAVGLMMLFKCNAMQHAETYTFGYSGMLVGSIILNFGSYEYFDIVHFVLGTWAAALLVVPTCALAFYFFPDPEGTAVAPKEQVNKDPREILEQTVLGWLAVMSVFLIFQLGDFNDSLSAQASMLIMLSPMTLLGARMAGRLRFIGTLAGCMAAMCIQLILYDMENNVILYLLSYAIASGLFCSWLARDDMVYKGLGFSAMAALTIPIAGIIPGQKDAFFAILYRVSSIFVGLIVTSAIIWIAYTFIKNTPWLFRGVERQVKDETS
ncbi:MAG TPA: DUF2955 domain-containing protein [Psychromonas hadalis]|nr:DUF2955 domain-containing protein [Psychromonas hadalis]